MIDVQLFVRSDEMEFLIELEGVRFGAIVGINQYNSAEQARMMIMSVIRSTVNLLTLLGVEEYKRQDDEGILGMLGSFDSKKLKDTEFNLIEK